MYYNGCNYLSMLGLKLNHVSKRGHSCMPTTGRHFSIKMLSHQYKNSHYEDKIFIMAVPILSKMVFILKWCHAPQGSVWQCRMRGEHPTGRDFWDHNSVMLTVKFWEFLKFYRNLLVKDHSHPSLIPASAAHFFILGSVSIERLSLQVHV